MNIGDRQVKFGSLDEYNGVGFMKLSSIFSRLSNFFFGTIQFDTCCHGCRLVVGDHLQWPLHVGPRAYHAAPRLPRTKQNDPTLIRTVLPGQICECLDNLMVM